MKRLCPACFTELPAEVNYCPKCGKCVRETVEQAKRYLGGTEEVIVIGIRDGAILIGGKKATIIEEGE
nr:MAG TPA: PROTEIN/RNA Complex, archaeal, ribosomal, 50S, protein.0A [Caudoviricetes sp.]